MPESQISEWLIERGIGETRAALIEDGAIVEARVELDGSAIPGTVLSARLIDRGEAGRNAVARDENGTDYLLPHAPEGVSQGALLNVEIVRSAIPGAEAWKRPLARATDQPPGPAPACAARAIAFPAPGPNALSDAGWDDLIEQVRSGTVNFAGGTLRLSVTPAMTLIDVDGNLPASDLAVTGAAEAARAIRRLDIGGSIGIDLPTVAGKSARQAAATAIDQWLPQPFERTAVNGFGFVQIIRPRRNASLLEFARDTAPFEARALLRRVALSGMGRCRLAAHPAVIEFLRCNRGWLEALARQLGGEVGLRADPALPMSAGHAEPA